MVMGNNMAAIVKERFGYEPGDDKYYDTVVKLGSNPNYGLAPAKKKVTVVKKAPVAKPTQSGGLGAKAMSDELERKKLFSI